MHNKFKVLFLSNIPSPYMVGYLNEFGKYCELTVVFEKAFDSTRPESWKNLLVDNCFDSVVLSGKSISKKIYGDNMDSAPDDKALSFSVVRYIKKTYDLVIVANPCTPTGIIAIGYMRMKGIRYSIQSEGGYPGDGKGFKEKLKYWLMNKAQYYFSTCDMDDAYFIQYGATKDRIKRYPFASLSEKELPKEYVNENERIKYKKLLSIDKELMILSVGRSVYVKGFDILLQALKEIPNNVCTYFVGGSCTNEYEEIIRRENLKDITFVENVEQQKLLEYYKAADIFVLPTRSDTWGLVINEAMTYGLPVITTDMCVAGDALINNDYNGYIVPVNSSDEIYNKLLILINDKNKRLIFGQRNYSMMKKWTYEEMGRVMYKHLCDIMEAD